MRLVVPIRMSHTELFITLQGSSVLTLLLLRTALHLLRSRPCCNFPTSFPAGVTVPHFQPRQLSNKPLPLWCRRRWCPPRWQWRWRGHACFLPCKLAAWYWNVFPRFRKNISIFLKFVSKINKLTPLEVNSAMKQSFHSHTDLLRLNFGRLEHKYSGTNSNFIRFPL